MESDIPSEGRILAVDDDRNVLKLIQQHLAETNYEVVVSQSVQDASKLLKKDVFEISLLDYLMPVTNGLDFARHIRETYKDMEIVIMTGFPDKPLIDAFRSLGIGYFLFKPFTDIQLIYTIHAALYHLRSMQTLFADRALEPALSGIIGVSEYCRHIRSEIMCLAPGEIPILISGETGTGKEVVARGIHLVSPRSSKGSLIPVNCAILGQLADSELFGHVKGSFTGAVCSTDGFIGSANGGTLFLDEIGDLPVETQAKLLRFLDTGEYVRVGESVPRSANVRIISATNRDLKVCIKEGRFREDLYYRIAGAAIHTSPLHSHPEDIPLLTWHFLQIFSNMRDQTFRISQHALNALMQYPWPGNVRQLKQIVHILTQRCQNREISYADVVHEIGQMDKTWVENYHDVKGAVIREFDRVYFSQLLVLADGSLSKALEISGMHKKNLYEKLKQYGLSLKLYSSPE